MPNYYVIEYWWRQNDEKYHNYAEITADTDEEAINEVKKINRLINKNKILIIEKNGEKIPTISKHRGL